MINFNVLNRWTGKVQFTAEIDCAENTPYRVKLGLAIRWGVKNDADLSGADLSGAVLSGADLSGAVLSGAVLRGAVLRGAVLSDADLSDADLSGAVLSGAVLRGAVLRGAVLSGAVLRGDKLIKWIAEARRGDGYSFIALLTESNGVKIKAGCRWFTDAEFRAHVAANYPGTDKATETLAILDYLAVRAAQVSPAVQTPSIAA